MRFMKWAGKNVLTFIMYALVFPFAVALIIPLWLIVEVMDAYDLAKRRGEA